MGRSQATGSPRPPQARKIGGGFLDGLRVVSSRPYLLIVACYVLLLAMGNTLLYFAQADIVAGVSGTREAQIAFFARLNLAVNIATVVMQFGVTAFLMQRLGVGFTERFDRQLRLGSRGRRFRGFDHHS